MLKTKDCAEAIRLVNLLNGRAVVVGGSSATGSGTGHATLGSTSSLLVECSPVKSLANSLSKTLICYLHDGVCDSF